MEFGFGGRLTGNELIAWKTEGLSDTLSILPMAHAQGHAACTNACGANQRPKADNEWFCKRFDGMEVFVIHDCDKPGQRGALGDPAKGRLGWATAIARYAKIVRNVVLPYEIAESKGKDLRDWVLEQQERRIAEAGIDPITAEGKEHLSRINHEIYADLLAYARQAEVIEPPDWAEKPPGEDEFDDDDDAGLFSDRIDDDQDGDDEAPIAEQVDDPHRLARLNLSNYQDETGGTLKYWRQQWYKYKDGRYRNISDSDLSAKVTAAIRREFEKQWRIDKEEYDEWLGSDNYDEKLDKGPPKIRPFRQSILYNVLSALKSYCLLSESVDMPSWLDDGSQPHWVSMKNGILDLDATFAEKDDDECLRPHSSDWFSTVQLAYDYEPGETAQDWYDYIETSMEGDQQRINILQEWAGYLLTQSADEQKFLVLEGDGGNGKTVYFAGITAMLGEQNVSQVPLEKFDGRFDLGTTIGKAANICGDTGRIDDVAEGVIKQYTGGGPMQFDRKNKEPISAIPTAKLMIAWNERPRIRDKTEGMWRRMLIVPFLRKVTKDERVKGMDSPEWWRKQGQVPGILNWAIAGLARLREQGDFTESDVSNAASDQYRKDANPALRFIDEHLARLPDAQLQADKHKELSKRLGVRTKDVYERYRKWCDAEGCKPSTDANLGKEIARKFCDVPANEFKHQRRDADGRYRVYVGLCFVDQDEDETVESDF